MELTREEVDALIEYHRTHQYEYARHEDYTSAEDSKRRAQEWSHYAAGITKGLYPAEDLVDVKPFIVEEPK